MWMLGSIVVQIGRRIDPRTGNNLQDVDAQTAHHPYLVENEAFRPKRSLHWIKWHCRQCPTSTMQALEVQHSDSRIEIVTYLCVSGCMDGEFQISNLTGFSMSRSHNHGSRY
jgi:hypothetical protein